MPEGLIFYWRYDTRAGKIRYWEMTLFHIILARRFERLPLAIAITNTSLTVSLYTRISRILLFAYPCTHNSYSHHQLKQLFSEIHQPTCNPTLKPHLPPLIPPKDNRLLHAVPMQTDRSTGHPTT